MPSHHFPKDPRSYQLFSWQDLDTLTRRLSRSILSQSHHFDRLIALATGGNTMSRSLRDYLGIPQLSNLHINFYTQIGETLQKPIITQPLSVSVAGEHLLLFDDINDTGHSLTSAVAYLKQAQAASITTATLFYKSHSHFSCDYKLRRCDAWIILPDETRETITYLNSYWTSQGICPKVIHQRLLSLGFTPSQLQLVKLATKCSTQ